MTPSAVTPESSLLLTLEEIEAQFPSEWVLVVDPEVEFLPLGAAFVDGRAYHGHEGVAKWLQEDWGSAWESYTLEAEELVDAGDVVVSIFTVTARGKGSGVEVVGEVAFVSTFHDGKTIRIEMFQSLDEALATVEHPA